MKKNTRKIGDEKVKRTTRESKNRILASKWRVENEQCERERSGRHTFKRAYIKVPLTPLKNSDMENFVRAPERWA